MSEATASDPRLAPAALAREARELSGTWREPSGFLGWFSRIDHKTTGRRFIITAFTYFVFAGLLAAATAAWSVNCITRASGWPRWRGKLFEGKLLAVSS